ncbi:MAG: class I SAM-dependent methyltransferase [Ginsengibacter sp.]
MAFSSDDLYTGSGYLKKNPNWDDDFSEWKAGLVMELIEKNKIQFKTVVEVGCGAGGILRHLYSNYKQAVSWRGFDISGDAIRLAKEKEHGSIEFFHADYLAITTEQNAELILCIDVVEHIDHYYGFLQKLQSKSGQFIFHIPLDLSCRSLLKPHIMLQQRQTVGHLHYFSKEMVEWMLKETGYEIVEWFYTKAEIDLEKPKGLKSFLKKYLRKFSFAINKNLSAHLWGGYSMMIYAKRNIGS